MNKLVASEIKTTQIKHSKKNMKRKLNFSLTLRALITMCKFIVPRQSTFPPTKNQLRSGLQTSFVSAVSIIMSSVVCVAEKEEFTGYQQDSRLHCLPTSIHNFIKITLYTPNADTQLCMWYADARQLLLFDASFSPNQPLLTLLDIACSVLFLVVLSNLFWNSVDVQMDTKNFVSSGDQTMDFIEPTFTSMFVSLL